MFVITVYIFSLKIYTLTSNNTLYWVTSGFIPLIDQSAMRLHFFVEDTLTSNNTLYWGHVRVQTFNRPISDEPTASFGINPSTHQRLLSDWSIYKCIYMSCICLDCQTDEWKVTWYDPHTIMLHVSVSSKNKTETTNT